MSHYIPTPNTSSPTAAHMPIRFSWLQPSFPGFFVGISLTCALLHYLGQPTEPWVCQSSSGVAARPRQKLCQPVVVRAFSKLSRRGDREFPLVSSPASPNNSDPSSCEIGLSNITIILHIITRSNSNHS